jgi:lipopolysaccharide transport system permease protein
MDRLAHVLELLYLLVLKELKVRYQSSVLGYVWALANPFAFAFVYWLAFKYIMRVQMENYSLYLITGLFPWVWLSSATTLATRSFQNNPSLVKKVRLPYYVLPMSNVAQEMVHFVFALPVIAGFLWVAGSFGLRSAWLWQIPLMIALQFAFIYPGALILALANAYVHDVGYLVGLAFSLLFFVTPMVYPIEFVPLELQPYFALNPLHALTDAWRSIFLYGILKSASVAYAMAWAALSGVLAWMLYRRLGPRLGERL